jgi:cyclic beta-1,2-glucan synthetase
MATQQHPAFDPNHPLPTDSAFRSAGWKRDYCGSATQRTEKVQYGQLWLGAILEAQSWKTPEERSRIPAFEAKLEAVKEVIEARTQELRSLTASGKKLTGDAEVLLGNSTSLYQGLQQLKPVVRKASELPQVQSNDSTIVPRVYAAVASYYEVVGYEFDEETFEQYFTAIQETVAFEMRELWQLRGFAKMALLESVAALAGRMDAAKFVQSSDGKPSVGETVAPEFAAALGMSTLAVSLRRIDGADWNDLFERVNAIEQILRKDPCDAYAGMDFDSRDNYRKMIAALAKRSQATEQDVARKAVELARPIQASPNARVRERQSHVGYYVAGNGRKTLEQAIGYRPTLTERTQRLLKRWPDFSYILGIEMLTLAVMAAVVFGAKTNVHGWMIVALFLLPAADCAVALVNQLVTTLFSPNALPKLDFSKGLPADFTTMVVVPTLLTSEAQMTRAVRDLEIRFLANRDANIHFALLTDPPDAAQQFDEKDKLAAQGSQLIEAMNAKYAGEGKGSFFLFHRHRAYNPSEGIWMAWERKRGKLLDFNKLLLGTSDNFPVKAGNLAVLPTVKYVITLDADTQLPRDAAHRLAGAIAHPLNRAVIDTETNIVVDGYGILQPRVDISIQSANRSRLASIFSGDAGFDVYARAASDVYQDLFSEGSFTGKGIYEVDAFQQVLEHRFPCNTILSHDMIEGAYARAGLVSDIEVVDDYPSHMSALSRRKHRWVRGDWQIVFWLLPRVPDFFGKTSRNPLSVISRWKILDNLRRSLTEIATFAMLLSAWILLPHKALYWTLATLVVIALPTYTQFAMSVLRAGKDLFTSLFWKNWVADFGIAQVNLFLRIASLCHQTLITIDAIVRSIVRMTVTHERLLEWETAAESESSYGKKSPFEIYLQIVPWLAFLIGVFIAIERKEAFMVALPLLVLWGLSKPTEQWFDLPVRTGETKMEAEDKALLRRSSLRTWRLFREFSTAEENWLIPDTIQKPDSLVVHRISTTNLGLLLNSRLAAVDLGFLSLPEFVTDTERTFDSIDRMPKHNGQMYNWYDNFTLDAVKPRFISAVDNGNLVCALWTVKQGCLGAITEPIFRSEIVQGVRDHLDTIDELFVAEGQDDSLLAAVREMKQRISSLGSSPETWLDGLAGCERVIVALAKKLSSDAFETEARWWVYELRLRISHLESLVFDFAPWLQPQFAKCCAEPAIMEIIRPEKLTLEALPKICHTLDQKIWRMLEEGGATVDSRSALQLLRSTVARTSNIAKSIIARLNRLAERSDTLVKGMDFKFFLDPKKKLLFTGFNAEEGKFTPSHYDLLASEVRAGVFAAIAKGEIPQESWLALERKMTSYKGEHVLLSWTGTMFEYLMPLLWMKTYPNTILDESTRAAVRSQIKYAETKSIPWGISEASCAKINAAGHYHYEAFGVPGMAVSRDLSRDLVVSPYSTFLSLLVDPKSAVKNIRRMADLGLLGSYGFYESADFTPSRLTEGKEFEIERCWLAHHQGMSLMSVANLLCDGSSRRRFHAEPMVSATERLLHEKAPRTTQFEAAGAPEGSELETGDAKELAKAGEENWAGAPKFNTAA